MTHARVLTWLVVALLTGTVAGCSEGAPTSSPASNEPGSATADLVCGLVGPDLVRRVVADAPIGTRGEEVDEAHGSFERCRVVDDQTGTIVMQLTIGSVDSAEWGPRLEQERDTASYGDCAETYEGDPGIGHGCTYETGVWRHGAAVHVLTDAHLIRATVYNWPGASPDERLALAEDVARDMEKNYLAARQPD